MKSKKPRIVLTNKIVLIENKTVPLIFAGFFSVEYTDKYLNIPVSNPNTDITLRIPNNARPNENSPYACSPNLDRIILYNSEKILPNTEPNSKMIAPLAITFIEFDLSIV